MKVEVRCCKCDHVHQMDDTVKGKESCPECDRKSGDETSASPPHTPRIFRALAWVVARVSKPEQVDAMWC